MMNDLISRAELLKEIPKDTELLRYQVVNAILSVPAVKVDGDTRAVLFAWVVATCPERCWKSKKHHDGSMYDGMFIVGVNTPQGQATYHYDIDPYWDYFRCEALEFAPEWDGHTPAQAIARIDSFRREICNGGGEKMTEVTCPYCGSKMELVEEYGWVWRSHYSCPRCYATSPIWKNPVRQNAIDRAGELALHRASPWHSVKDGLPDSGTVCLVHGRNKRGVECYDLACKINTGWEFGSLSSFEVVHWMNMPEAPKADGSVEYRRNDHA